MKSFRSYFDGDCTGRQNSVMTELSNIQQDNGCTFQNLTPDMLSHSCLSAWHDVFILHGCCVTFWVFGPTPGRCSVTSPLSDAGTRKPFHGLGHVLVSTETPQQVSHEVGPGRANSPERKRDMSKVSELLDKRIDGFATTGPQFLEP
ncbi:hypothetical protein AV530_013671 [Patagioenas fasciata monilis]|uniref:Uncharacterized protein n=1 Tax=Patagioenas fasciata monilis TaxID=372326 RepID=A0A1V4J7C0_PATFA|nr:hypothetical protein AV530_013671 [Patagioenas fasciata monilis]